jgi:hypothetical protein
MEQTHEKEPFHRGADNRDDQGTAGGNAKLKRLLADTMLDNVVLKDLLGM